MNGNSIIRRGRKPFNNPDDRRHRVAARISAETKNWLDVQIAKLPEGKERNLGRFLDKLVKEIVGV